MPRPDTMPFILYMLHLTLTHTFKTSVIIEGRDHGFQSPGIKEKGLKTERYGVTF